MIRRIGLIAGRDIVATVVNKGFLFGLLIMPLMMGVLIWAGPRILNSRTPPVVGNVAVIDPTGMLTAALKTSLLPETIRERRAVETRRQVAEAVPGAGGQAQEQVVEQAAAGQSAIAPVPALTIVERPADADVQREKDWLLPKTPEDRPLALVVFHPDAVTRAGGAREFGSYDLFVSTLLDAATEGVLFESLRQTLVSARLAASSLDQAAIEATMRVNRPPSVIVGVSGEQQAVRGFNRSLPLVMGVFLFMGVMIGGQTLMGSTIEEKSNRVIEVLLAAASPFELMAGKLLGQLVVGLISMGVYVGLGILALFQFSMFGLFDPMLVVYLVIFFFTSYLIYGAMMMTIGAAVNTMADAGSMMGPVMLLLVVPFVFLTNFSRAPNSAISVAMSLIPPFNGFGMMARLASGTPPPFWQVLLSIALGLVASAATVWFAGKVFKIGLLMHGKPPTLATMIRWARMA
jgi:ABC-2 type transport system permease protein